MIGVPLAEGHSAYHGTFNNVTSMPPVPTMASPLSPDTSRHDADPIISTTSDHSNRSSQIAATTSQPTEDHTSSIRPGIQPQCPVLDEQADVSQLRDEWDRAMAVNAISSLSQDEHMSRLQLYWNDAITRNMDVPEGYAQVAVLIIKWAEHLDDLNTGDEVGDG